MRAEPTNLNKADTTSDHPYNSDRQDEFLMEALEGILEEEICEHTPEKLDLLDTDYQGDRIIHHSQCECGKRVKEIFTLSETKIS